MNITDLHKACNVVTRYLPERDDFSAILSVLNQQIRVVLLESVKERIKTLDLLKDLIALFNVEQKDKIEKIERDTILEDVPGCPKNFNITSFLKQLVRDGTTNVPVTEGVCQEATIHILNCDDFAKIITPQNLFSFDQCICVQIKLENTTFTECTERYVEKLRHAQMYR